MTGAGQNAGRTDVRKSAAIVLGVLAIVVLGQFRDSPGSGLRIISSADERLFFAALHPSDFLAFAIALALLWLPTPPARAHGGAQRAGLLRRFAGFLVDALIYFTVVLVPMTLVALVVEAAQADGFAWTVQRDAWRGSDAWLAALVPLSMLVMAVLFARPLWRVRQSPGNLVFDTHLVSETPLRKGQAIWRSVLGFFTLSLAFLSVPAAWVRDDRRMWHDLRAGTRLLRQATSSATEAPAQSQSSPR